MSRHAALNFMIVNGNITTFTTDDGDEFEMDTSKVLGKGAQGQVHLARNTKTGEVVAVKAMPVKHLILDDAGAAKMKIIDDEIAILKAVGRHPNIAGMIAGVDLYRPGTTDYCHFKNIVMEFVKGKELAEQIAVHGPLDEDTARHVLKQILAALQYLHSRNIVHRDLKAENVLVTGDRITLDSQVKLIDFGVATLKGNENFKTLVGTLAIMPPEMAKAKITYLPDPSLRKVHVAKFKAPSAEYPGFGFTQRTAEGYGARLINVDPNSPAGRQGVRNDWLLTKINDIDVENMLFQGNADDSSHAKKPKIVNTLMGLTSDFTVELIEMPERSFTQKVDMWAVGVLLYTCLCGQVPFKSELEIIESEYNKELLAKSSDDAKSLIAGLLQKEPTTRLSLRECLAHPWVNK